MLYLWIIKTILPSVKSSAVCTDRHKMFKFNFHIKAISPIILCCYTEFYAWQIFEKNFVFENLKTEIKSTIFFTFSNSNIQLLKSNTGESQENYTFNLRYFTISTCVQFENIHFFTV
jgi:hypothetical protein